MYHGYHFVYQVLFQFIFYGIFGKSFAEIKKKGYFLKLAQIIFKKMSLIYFSRCFIHCNIQYYDSEKQNN